MVLHRNLLQPLYETGFLNFVLYTSNVWILFDPYWTGEKYNQNIASQMTFLRQRTNKNITGNRKNKSFQNNTYINSTD